MAFLASLFQILLHTYKQTNNQSGRCYSMMIGNSIFATWAGSASRWSTRHRVRLLRIRCRPLTHTCGADADADADGPLSPSHVLINTHTRTSRHFLFYKRPQSAAVAAGARIVRARATPGDGVGASVIVGWIGWIQGYLIDPPHYARSCVFNLYSILERG